MDATLGVVMVVFTSMGFVVSLVHLMLEIAKSQKKE